MIGKIKNIFCKMSKEAAHSRAANYMSNKNQPFIHILGEEKRNRLGGLIAKMHEELINSKNPLSNEEISELFSLHRELLKGVGLHYTESAVDKYGIFCWLAKHGKVNSIVNGEEKECFISDRADFPPMPIGSWKHYIEHINNAIDLYYKGLKHQDYIPIQ